MAKGSGIESSNNYLNLREQRDLPESACRRVPSRRVPWHFIKDLGFMKFLPATIRAGKSQWKSLEGN